ncbi:MAG: DUF3795 domain-containing protein [Phycisphaerae bacterium]|jgi:hypothetical protein
MTDKCRRDFLKKTLTAGAFAAAGCIGFSGCREKQESNLKRPDENGPDFGRIAYCGIYCDTCPLYKATVANDDDAKLAVAKQWGAAEKSDFKLEDYYCYGCKDKRSVSRLVCYYCTVKECAVKRGLAVCSQCADLERCDEKLWDEFPWIRETAMSLRNEPGIL